MEKQFLEVIEHMGYAKLLKSQHLEYRDFRSSYNLLEYPNTIEL
jgi:hypothetical protein